MEMILEFCLCLEIVWEIFEDGGYICIRLDELWDGDIGVGVFIGNMYNQYFWNILLIEQVVFSLNGGDWYIVNCVFYFFNFIGLSIVVSFVCFSLLNVIYFVCESLKLNSCFMVIVGGVNLIFDFFKYDFFECVNLLENGN